MAEAFPPPPPSPDGTRALAGTPIRRGRRGKARFRPSFASPWPCVAVSRRRREEGRARDASTRGQAAAPTAWRGGRVGRARGMRPERPLPPPRRGPSVLAVRSRRSRGSSPRHLPAAPPSSSLSSSPNLDTADRGRRPSSRGSSARLALVRNPACAGRRRPPSRRFARPSPRLPRAREESGRGWPRYPGRKHQGRRRPVPLRADCSRAFQPFCHTRSSKAAPPWLPGQAVAAAAPCATEDTAAPSPRPSTKPVPRSQRSDFTLSAHDGDVLAWLAATRPKTQARATRRASRKGPAVGRDVP